MEDYYNSLKYKYEEFRINQSSLTNIIKKLPNNKSVGEAGISNEMIKYANSTSLNSSIRELFESIFSTGVVPKRINIGKLTPIIKNNSQPSNCLKNIRPITISDTISNIFERYILIGMNEQIKDNKSQFGFTNNSSTQHALFTLRETTNYYIMNKSRIYACAIDASKAFDKVWRDGLFYKMISKLNWAYWRALYGYYNISIIYIQLDGKKTKEFLTTAGVKQGGPLSPKLYNIYIEELIPSIEKEGLGARVGKMKISVIVYADDIMVISPTRIGMEKMISTVHFYMTKWKIKMNLEKTSYMLFGRARIVDSIVNVEGKIIEKVTVMTYLGVTLDENLNMNNHVLERTKKCMKSSYSLYNIGIMSNSMDIATKQYLYKTYCRPTLLYGIEMVPIKEKNDKNDTH